MTLKKMWLFCLAVVLAAALAFPVSALAQHFTQPSWQAPAGITGVGYNVYRADGTVTTPTSGVKLNSAPVMAVTYTDSTVAAGQVYSYWVKTVCVTCPVGIAGESATATNIVTVTIPSDTPPPPTDLQINNVAMNTVGNKTTVAASWTAPARIRTTWTLTDGNGKKLASGAKHNKKGAYQISKTIKNLNGVPTFTVCDASGCVSQKAS